MKRSIKTKMALILSSLSIILIVAVALAEYYDLELNIDLGKIESDYAIIISKTGFGTISTIFKEEDLKGAGVLVGQAVDDTTLDDTHQPIFEAKIQIKNNSGNVISEVKSDAQGNFRIQIPGKGNKEFQLGKKILPYNEWVDKCIRAGKELDAFPFHIGGVYSASKLIKEWMKDFRENQEDLFQWSVSGNLHARVEGLERLYYIMDCTLEYYKMVTIIKPSLDNIVQEAGLQNIAKSAILNLGSAIFRTRGTVKYFGKDLPKGMTTMLRGRNYTPREWAKLSKIEQRAIAINTPRTVIIPERLCVQITPGKSVQIKNLITGRTNSINISKGVSGGLFSDTLATGVDISGSGGDVLIEVAAAISDVGETIIDCVTSFNCEELWKKILDVEEDGKSKQKQQTESNPSLNLLEAAINDIRGYNFIFDGEQAKGYAGEFKEYIKQEETALLEVLKKAYKEIEKANESGDPVNAALRNMLFSFAPTGSWMGNIYNCHTSLQTFERLNAMIQGVVKPDELCNRLKLTYESGVESILFLTSLQIPQNRAPSVARAIPLQQQGTSTFQLYLGTETVITLKQTLETMKGEVTSGGTETIRDTWDEMDENFSILLPQINVIRDQLAFLKFKSPSSTIDSALQHARRIDTNYSLITSGLLLYILDPGLPKDELSNYLEETIADLSSVEYDWQEHNLETNTWAVMWDVFSHMYAKEDKLGLNMNDFINTLLERVDTSKCFFAFNKDKVKMQLIQMFEEKGFITKLKKGENNKFEWEWEEGNIGIFIDKSKYYLELSLDKRFSPKDVVSFYAGAQTSMDLSKISSSKGLAKLGKLSPGQYYWRVANKPSELQYSFKTSQYVGFQSPVYSMIGTTTITKGRATIGPNGGQVKTGQGTNQKSPPSKAMALQDVTGDLDIPPGALNEDTTITVFPITLTGGLDDFKVIGDTIYELGPTDLYFNPGKPAVLTFNYQDAPDLDETALGIYRWDTELDRWDYLSGVIDRVQNTVRVEIDHLGIFGLLIDTKMPEITDVQDSPDPILPQRGDRCTISYKLSEPAYVTMEIRDGKANLMRVMLNNALQKTLGNSISWDGKDASGNTVTDGKYYYHITARDIAGYYAKPGIGSIFVLSGQGGTVKGVVMLEGEADAEGVRVAVKDTTLGTTTLADGRYEISGVPQGSQTIEFRCPGYFARSIPVPVQEGENQLATLTLTNRITSNFSISSAKITPDNDGIEDNLVISYELAQDALISVGIYDPAGNPVCRLMSDTKQYAGKNSLNWDSRNESGTVVRNDHYIVKLLADASGIKVIQETAKVLVDTGLVKSCRLMPEDITPNDDGRDDELGINLELTNDGMVTIGVYDANWQIVGTITERASMKAGPNEIIWRGRFGTDTIIQDGRYILKIDSCYSTGERSIPVTAAFEVDVNPPVILSLTPENAATLTNTMPTIRAIIKADKDDINPDRVQIKIDEYFACPEFNPDTGEVSFTPSTALGAGAHTVIVYARDKAGNKAQPVSNTFYIEMNIPDTLLPTISNLTPANESICYIACPSVQAVLRDIGSGIDTDSMELIVDGTKIINQVQLIGIPHSLGGTAIDMSTGKDYWTEYWQYTKEILLYNPWTGVLRYNPLEPFADNSKHFVTLKVKDREGNWSNIARTDFTVVIDKKPPTINILTPGQDSEILEQQPIVLAILGDDASGVEIYNLRVKIDGKEYQPPAGAYNSTTGMLSFPVLWELARESQHLITIDVTDKAGNAAEQAEVLFTVIGDDKGPAIKGLYPADGSYISDPRPTISALILPTGKGPIATSSITVKLDGTVTADRGATSCSYDVQTGSFTCTFTVDLSGGRHVVTVDAQDIFGNAAKQAVSIFRVSSDITPPIITLISPGTDTEAAGIRPEIRIRITDNPGGVGIDFTSIRLKIDRDEAVLLPEMYNLQTGILTYTPQIPLLAGAPHILIVSAEDRIGNKSGRLVSVFKIKPLGVGEVINIVITPTPSPGQRRYINTQSPVIEARISEDGQLMLSSSKLVLQIDGSPVEQSYAYASGHSQQANKPQGCPQRVAPGGRLMLGNGTHTITVVDENRRKDKVIASRDVVVDVVKPEIGEVTYQGSVIGGQGSGINTVIKDAYGEIDASSLEVKVDGKVVGHTYESQAGRLSAPLSPGGIHQVQIRVKDMAGNETNKAVVMGASIDLSRLTVYPNPLCTTDRDYIIFKNLPANTTIKIFNIAGELVKTLTNGNENEVRWYADNDEGRKVASGIYIYLIKDQNGNKKTGKIGVIR